MSAVFVKMPPPAFANSASELAPNENAITTSALPEIRYTSAAPASEVPTTAMPMTAPPRKPAMNDFWIDSRAALADFMFAIVAIEMPTYPASAESTVPNR
ncbi:MAG: hypothetical protein BWY81_01496 [Firmicutes bacterium ADurb.Bin467]|nr:MAG: hypothetical protein BWY81_01496 [Firmicutes bacterium ADurb.Bin467]